jgi:hypothetical protein
VLSAGRGDSDAADKGFGAYSAGATRVHNHSVAEFASFFGPLELVPRFLCFLFFVLQAG